MERKARERRIAERHRVNLDIEWEGLVGRQTGTLSDVSEMGCFILCSGDVENGETVRVFFPIGDGMKVQILGEVVNHVFEIGFGIRFIDINEPQRDFLRGLIARKAESEG